MQPAGERSTSSGPSSPNSAHEIVELVVLTADENFLAILREAAGTATRIWHVSAPDKVSDLLLAGEVGILAVDGASIPSSIASFVEQLKLQFPELVILVAGNRDDETRLSGLISNGTVYRFIHKPLSSARARLFVQAALRKREDPGSTMVVPAMIKPPRRSNHLLVGGGVALALALGIGIWFGFHRTTAPAPAPVATTDDTLMRRAADALAANRLIAPPGDNALELYLARLARAPGDAAARAGLADVHERLLARAENALMEERLEEAVTAIEDARRSGVESGRIAFLSAQLNKARNGSKPAALLARPAASATATAAATTATAETPHDDTLARELRSAAERLDQGRLIEPEADSALFHVQRAIGLDPADLGVQQTRRALAARLLLEARTAMQARDFDNSNRLLLAAAGIASQSDIDAARSALQSMRNEAQAKAAQSSATTNTATAGASAAAAPAGGVTSDNTAGAGNATGGTTGNAAPTVVGAASLTRLSGSPPEYPIEAARRRQEGWVDLEFTVRADGSVHEPIVRNAQPAGVFEQAAVRAVQTWRFKSVLRDGKPVEQRARLRLRFSLSQQ